MEKTRTRRATSLGYDEDHARSGLKTELPPLETFPNQFPAYEIVMEIPEFTSVCPKTGLPDFGKLTITYVPDRDCVELKSLKLYLLAYRGLGIFYENVINRVLDDFAAAVKPARCEVRGEFTPRGGIRSTVTARYPRAGG